MVVAVLQWQRLLDVHSEGQTPMSQEKRPFLWDVITDNWQCIAYRAMQCIALSEVPEALKVFASNPLLAE